MDPATCVARRTRSRTEIYLNSLLNQAKKVTQSDASRARRAFMRNARSHSPEETKRRRKKAKHDADVEFVGTLNPQGKLVPEDGDVAGSTSPRLEEEGNSPDRVSDFSVNDVISRDDDVVFVETIPPEHRNVEDEKSPDDVISLSDDDCPMEEASAEDDDNDYSQESDDSSSYTDTSDSDFVNSEDDEAGATDTAKVRKRSRKKVPKSTPFSEKNDSDVFHLLEKSIWDRTKLFEEDTSSGDETAKVHTTQDALLREQPSEVVRERRVPRSSSRKKREKNEYDSDLLRNSFCESVDGAEKLWDDQDTVNLQFGSCEEPVLVEKTEGEREIDRLWEDMALALRLEGLDSSTPAKKNGDVSCINGTHSFVLDEEIGLKCCYCSYVAVEIRDVSPAMDKYQANVYDKKTYNDKKGNPLFNGFEFEGSDHASFVTSLDNLEGTVWDYVPGIKDSLYPHQQEGFEFLWNNLAGTTKLDELKSSGVRESGGCVISHDPGSGKTRLTIVFLQSYLERFPDSHPVVIAPASLLLTWEEEFRKWEAKIPFYNMNSLEFSGDEDKSAVSCLNNRSDKLSVRLVKLYSWRCKKSVLGLSYNLYEMLAGKKCAGEMLVFKKMLLQLPGLLVLDEGHTPRNQTSCIWKVLTEVRTEKRIILSGTPFQNNFKELSNVLCLAKPACSDVVSSRLQDLSKWSQDRQNGRSFEEFGIEELRDMIAPFVHVHRKDFLQESLPGLKDCVVVLNPPFQQQSILTRIDPLLNTFELEHKLSAVSVHPSLYLHCKPTSREHWTIGERRLETLKKLRLDSKEGAKTRFLIDFIRLSEIVKEKVLVFSQYIDTLKLVRDQISAVFGWTEGKEILLMHGQVEQKDRQHLITNFNKPDSKSKVLLASIRACSEGINLVGASRVVLLDVVWNPSVERQAISRAYRIGQTRVVYTYHLMVKGTHEWDKYCKQTKKSHISELVFSSNNEKDKEISNEVVSEDRILDEMVKHEKQKDMFEKILYRPKESYMSTNIF